MSPFFALQHLKIHEKLDLDPIPMIPLWWTQWIRQPFSVSKSVSGDGDRFSLGLPH